MCPAAVETEIQPLYLVCCVFVAFVLVCVCVSVNTCVSADNTHHSSLTFIMCVVHREEERVNENSEGSNAVCACQMGVCGRVCVCACVCVCWGTCTCTCILSDGGLINDVCVGGPWFYAYRDVVGNGLEPCCSPPLSSQAKERRKRWMVEGEIE